MINREAAPRRCSDTAARLTSHPYKEDDIAKSDDTSKGQPGRNQSTEGVPAETSRNVPAGTCALQQAIDSERARLLQVRSVLHCLYEVLLYAEGDEAVTYAEAAHLAANLIDESVERLDPVRLKPLVEALKNADSHGPYEPNLQRHVAREQRPWAHSPSQ